MAHNSGLAARGISVGPTAGPLPLRVASWALVWPRSISGGARSPTSIAFCAGDKAPAVPLPGLLRFYSRKPYYTTGNERLNGSMPGQIGPTPCPCSKCGVPMRVELVTPGESRLGEVRMTKWLFKCRVCHRGYDQAKNQMKSGPGASGSSGMALGPGHFARDLASKKPWALAGLFTSMQSRQPIVIPRRVAASSAATHSRSRLRVIRYRGGPIRMSGFAKSRHELNCENVANGQ
jgi:hypothetical protein